MVDLILKQLIGKLMVDLILKLFLLSLEVETLQAEIGRSRRFSKGVAHIQHRFQREGASPINHCW